MSSSDVAHSIEWLTSAPYGVFRLEWFERCLSLVMESQEGCGLVGHLWVWALDACVILWATREGKTRKETKRKKTHFSVFCCDLI